MNNDLHEDFELMLAVMDKAFKDFENYNAGPHKTRDLIK